MEENFYNPLTKIFHFCSLESAKKIETADRLDEGKEMRRARVSESVRGEYKSKTTPTEWEKVDFYCFNKVVKEFLFFSFLCATIYVRNSDLIIIVSFFFFRSVIIAQYFFFVSVQMKLKNNVLAGGKE